MNAIRHGTGIPFALRNAITAAMESAAAGAVRADAATLDADEATILWGAALSQSDDRMVRALRAEARELGLLNRRADAQFFADDLNSVVQGGNIYYRPKSRNALLSAIPVLPVDAWADTFTARFGDTAGLAAPYRPDGTQPPLVTSEVQEGERRPILTLWNALPEGYVLRQQRQLAGYSTRPAELEQAVYGHARAMNLGLISGITGFGGWSLQTHPGFLRMSGSVTYGATGTGARDAMYEDFARILQTQRLQNPEVDIPAPNTMLVTSRIMAALKRPSNFEAGGYTSAGAELERIIRDNGITAVIECDELRDYGGANVDGMVLFNRDDLDGLRHVLPLRPAPVATETMNLVTLQYFMSRTGLLYARQPRGVLVAEITISI